MDYDLTFRPNAGRFEEALVNFPGIWGLDAAVQLHLADGSKKTEQHIGNLIRLAAEELQMRDCEILSPCGDEEWSGILSFRDPRRPPEAIVQRLFDAKVDAAVRAGAIRISPTIYNDAADIEALLDALG